MAHLLVAPFTAAEGCPLARRGRGVMAEAARVAISAAPVALEVGAHGLAHPIHVPLHLLHPVVHAGALGHLATVRP